MFFLQISIVINQKPKKCDKFFIVLNENNIKLMKVFRVNEKYKSLRFSAVENPHSDK